VIPNLVVPPWPTPEPDEPISEFSERLLEEIPATNCLVVGGASFGGMVAQELAARLRPRAVVLIGSCRDRTSLMPLARHLRGLARALPVSWFHPRRWSLPFILPKFGRLTAAQRQLFWAMAAATPAAFLKWGIEAILSWRPTPVSAPVYHIHGRADRLIPARLVEADRIVPGGGHLLTLTHPDEVNAFLQDVIASARTGGRLDI
jgi:pimeloyl-ACP methyl ester carboxylesterase